MKYTRTITEAKAYELACVEYRQRPLERMEKLNEETSELHEALRNDFGDPKEIEKIKNELGDCWFLLNNLICHYGTSSRELADRTMNKIIIRRTNPDYMRDIVETEYEEVEE